MDEAPLMTIHFIFGQEEMRITNHAKFLGQESNDPCHNNCQPFTMVDDGGGDGGGGDGGDGRYIPHRNGQVRNVSSGQPRNRSITFE